MSKLYVLSAPFGAGKTTFCVALARHAREANWVVAGLVSPAMFSDGVKTGILIQDLHTDETRSLAIAKSQCVRGTCIEKYDLSLGQWLFSSEAVRWGNLVLERSPQADLLIVDELGPLEFVRNEGWTQAFHRLSQPKDKIALVVVRPALVAQALSVFPHAQMLDLSTDVPTFMATLTKLV